MAKKFEDLVNDMVNIGFGAAAVAVEKTREVMDDLSAKGEQVRSEREASDFTRSMSDIFTQAGGAFTDVTERLATSGETVAERILDELIVARVRPMAQSDREAFIGHVSDLVNSVDDATHVESVAVKVEVDAEGKASGTPGAEDGASDVEQSASQDAPVEEK